MTDLLDVPYPAWKDGLSFLPSLTGAEQADPDYVVFAGNVGPALVTPAGWKVRYLTPVRRVQLFYQPDDYKSELLATFEKAAEHQPFRTDDAFLAVYKHRDGQLLYLTGTDYFAVDDGPVTIRINRDIKVRSAVDYVTGEKIKINTHTPGGVVRVLLVRAKQQ